MLCGREDEMDGRRRAEMISGRGKKGPALGLVVCRSRVSCLLYNLDIFLPLHLATSAAFTFLSNVLSQTPFFSPFVRSPRGWNNSSKVFRPHRRTGRVLER